MRFVQLELRAFGSFANAPPIDFGAGGRGLHLILGPNEAGKSTALRAIRRLLFGFPLRAGDDHRHDYKNLRIAATLQDESGNAFEFVRRKTNRIEESLWTLEDSEKIDHARLNPFLGGLDQARFIDLFSMDHKELIEGGKLILQGGGRIGELLFAAGSGMAGVDQVKKRLQEETDDLFKPRGVNPTINASLVKLEKARRDVKDSMVETKQWVDLDHKITGLKHNLEENDIERRRLEETKKRREAIAKALPILRRRDDEAAWLELRRGVPILIESFSETRRNASTDRVLAAQSAAGATANLETIARELAVLGPPDEVLVEAEAILQIQTGLRAYQKARRARPESVAKLARVEAEAVPLLAEFLPGLTVEQLGEAQVLASKRSPIVELALRSEQLEAACVKADSEVEDLSAKIPGLGGEPLIPEAERFAEALKDAVERVTKAGDPQGTLDEARAERIQAEREAEVELRALRRWSGSLTELVVLKVPPIPMINRYDEDFRNADQAISQAKAELARATEARLTLEREIEVVRLASPVPSEADLKARRADRDQTWRQVRSAWLGEAGSIVPPSELAARLEAEARDADELADRLRREADRVAQQSRREADLLDVIARLESLGENLTNAMDERGRMLEVWQGLWRPLGVEPESPQEMRDWVTTERNALVLKAKEILHCQLKEDKAAEKVAGFRADLSQALVLPAESPADPAESLAALHSRAKRAVARVENLRDLAQARSRRATALENREVWRAKWVKAVGPLGLDADASPTRATALLDGIDRAVTTMKDRAKLVQEVAESERVEAEWEAEVQAVRDRLEIESPDVEPEDLAKMLRSSLEKARVANTKREDLLTRQTAEQSRLDQANAEADRAAVTLEGLAREAGCASIDDLPAAERASEEVKEARKSLARLEEQLSVLAGSIPFDSFLDDARAADPAAIDAEVVALADQLAPLDEKRDRLSRELGGAEEQLKRIDGGPAAADAQQQVEEQLAFLALNVEKYAKLRLASAVLREAVERHRKQNQGPVLQRAGDLFASLTLGSFAGLRDEYNNQGEPILCGIRGDDGTTPLAVDAMSEGTADQLYLALRLASLHAHLDGHEPMPLVLDDVLVNFDDARAAAALKALAELSARTQILFFTHHAHLIALARQTLPESLWFVHHLAYPPAPVESDGAAVEPPRAKRRKKATAEDVESPR